MKAVVLECTEADSVIIEAEIVRWIKVNTGGLADGLPCASGAAISDMIQDLKFYRDLYEKEGRVRSNPT